MEKVRSSPTVGLSKRPSPKTMALYDANSSVVFADQTYGGTGGWLMHKVTVQCFEDPKNVFLCEGCLALASASMHMIQKCGT